MGTESLVFRSAKKEEVATTYIPKPSPRYASQYSTLNGESHEDELHNGSLAYKSPTFYWILRAFIVATDVWLVVREIRVRESGAASGFR